MDLLLLSRRLWNNLCWRLWWMHHFSPDVLELLDDLQYPQDTDESRANIIQSFLETSCLRYSPDHCLAVRLMGLTSFYDQRVARYWIWAFFTFFRAISTFLHILGTSLDLRGIQWWNTNRKMSLAVRLRGLTSFYDQQVARYCIWVILDLLDPKIRQKTGFPGVNFWAPFKKSLFMTQWTQNGPWKISTQICRYEHFDVVIPLTKSICVIWK